MAILEHSTRVIDLICAVGTECKSTTPVNGGTPVYIENKVLILPPTQDFRVGYHLKNSQDTELTEASNLSNHTDGNTA